MLILNIIALTILFSVGAVFFIEYKIVEDLPETNSFKRWWREHIIDTEPRD